jgi:hypothetical protein
MADLNQAAAIGVEIEKLNASVYPQFNQDAKFYGRLQNLENYKVSERLVRIPILAQPGSTFAQFVPDGTTDSMGTGGGEQYDVGVASPVFFNQACQVTKGAEWSTDGKEKSVVDVYKDSFRINLKAFRTNLEALMAVSDGSGVLGTVSVTPVSNQNYIQVSNANDFQAGVTYQVIPAGFGSTRGNIVVLTCDLINNILYLVEISGAYYPSGTEATDMLLPTGAPGTQTTTYAPDRYTSATVSASLNGCPAINYQSSSGDWFGIPRSTWPGVLNSAYVNGSSDALVPQQFQLLESLLQRANGSDADELTDFVVQANTDQVTAWENLGLYSQSGAGGTFNMNVTQFSEGNNEAGSRKDYLPKGRVKTMAGHELIVNIKARQQRIDCINFKYWFKTEVKPPSLFDVGGMTTFPLYGADGGVAPTTAFYFVFGGQIANCKPRAGAYIDSLALPLGWSN